MTDRLDRQMAFLDAIETLKTVYRRNRTIDRSRFENSAEHSWHLAVMALILSEHAPESVDLFRVVKMLLVHDLVEIHAGDTWLYDTDAHLDQAERERLAADQLFGLLPDDQAAELLALWQEFEARATPEAAYAAALDALQPLANHVLSGAPDDPGVRPDARHVRERKRHIEASSPILWRRAERLIAISVEKDLYSEGGCG